MSSIIDIFHSKPARTFVAVAALAMLGCGPDDEGGTTACIPEPTFELNEGNYTKDCSPRDEMIVYEVMDPNDSTIPLATPLPVVLYLGGAGFNLKAGHNSQGIITANKWGQEIVDRGYIGVAIDHERTNESVKKLHGTNMVAAAVRWLKAHSYYYLDPSDNQVKYDIDNTVTKFTDLGPVYGKKFHIDPTKIAVFGVSNGGYHALQLGIMDIEKDYDDYAMRVQLASDNYTNIEGEAVTAGWVVPPNDPANEVAKEFSSDILGAVAVSSGADLIAGFTYCAVVSDNVPYGSISMSSEYLSTGIPGVESCVPVDPNTGILDDAKHQDLLAARAVLSPPHFVNGDFNIPLAEYDETTERYTMHEHAVNAINALSPLDYAQSDGQYTPPILILNGKRDAFVRPEAGMLTGRFLKQSANNRVVITSVFDGSHQSSPYGSFDARAKAATWKFFDTLFNNTAEIQTATNFSATFMERNSNQSAHDFFCKSNEAEIWCDTEGTTLSAP